ncbi:MAG: hypothetical protein M5R36_17145 [Deltaproteobacteria bacterium]|nr:hypothetical protein [Deltaproteobacteria bacterium]
MFPVSSRATRPRSRSRTVSPRCSTNPAESKSCSTKRSHRGGEDHAWTSDERDELANETFNLAVPDDTIKIHSLFLDGHDESDGGGGSILGIAWSWTHLVMYKQTIEDSCGGLTLGGLTPGLRETLCRMAEQTVWTHEIGHLIGLVDNGLPMVEDHKDPDEAHGDHDASKDCVMYWAHEGESVVGFSRRPARGRKRQYALVRRRLSGGRRGGARRMKRLLPAVLALFLATALALPLACDGGDDDGDDAAECPGARGGLFPVGAEADLGTCAAYFKTFEVKEMFTDADFQFYEIAGSAFVDFDGLYFLRVLGADSCESRLLGQSPFTLRAEFSACRETFRLQLLTAPGGKDDVLCELDVEALISCDDRLRDETGAT